MAWRRMGKFCHRAQKPGREREREVKFFCGISGPLLGLGQDWSWIFRSDMQAAKGMGEES